MINPTWRAYALAGQSNARGDNDDHMVGVPIALVQLVDEEAPGGFAHGKAMHPTWWDNTSPAGAPRVGPGAGMAEEYCKQPGRAFRLVKDAVSGSPISDWISTYGPRHIAMMQATGWTFDGGLVWVQGENEASNGAATYQADLATLFALYRAAFPGLKICIVKLAGSFSPSRPHTAAVRAAQEAYVASDPLCTIVNVDDFDGLQWDGVHRTGEQNRIIGARCVTALAAL